MRNAIGSNVDITEIIWFVVLDLVHKIKNKTSINVYKIVVRYIDK